MKKPKIFMIPQDDVAVEARKTRYGRTLKQVSEYINAHTRQLGITARVSSWTANTDKHWKGMRLRWPGKGRKGSRIEVTHKGRVVLDHKNSETYRSVEEVRRWLYAWECGYVYTFRGWVQR